MGNKIQKELFEETLDLQNYILGKTNNMTVIKNTLGTGTDGVAIGTVLSKEIVRTLKERANAFGFFSGRVGKGNFEIIVISNETGAEWIAEGEAPLGKGSPKTSKLILKQNRLYKEIELTQQLINSSTEDFVDEIKNIVVDAIENTLEKAIFIGTGISQPTGIITELNETRKIVLDKLGGITLDVLKKAKSKINGNDWNNCSWFLDSTTLLAIDNLKDEIGRPLLQPNPSKPTEQFLLGIKIKNTKAIPKFDEIDSAIMILAHKEAYKTNTQETLTLDVYNDSEYKKKGIVALASNIYVDGICKNENKVVAIYNPKV